MQFWNLMLAKHVVIPRNEVTAAPDCLKICTRQNIPLAEIEMIQSTTAINRKNVLQLRSNDQAQITNRINQIT